MSPAESGWAAEVSTPKISAAARWREGFDGAVNFKTEGPVTATLTCYSLLLNFPRCTFLQMFTGKKGEGGEIPRGE